MSNVIVVKAFSTPYDLDRRVVSASSERRINKDNIEDLVAETNQNQPAIKTRIYVKYTSGRETKAGAYLVNETVAALTTAINT